MTTLLVDLGGGEIRQIALTGERITIGRRLGSDVYLPHASVSAEHAAIIAEPGGYAIEDLASRNGTLVNGVRVMRRRLNDRDLIGVGVHRLVFRSRLAAAIQPAADAVGTSPGHGWPLAFDAAAQRPAGPDAEESGASVTVPDSDARPIMDPVPPATLVVRSGARAGEEIPLSRRLTSLGRDGTVQAWMVQVNGGMFIVPAGGAVAIAVDSKPVGPEGRRLEGGEVLAIGDREMLFLGTD